MLKIQAGDSFERLEQLYQATRRHIPVDIKLDNHREVKLISR